MTARGKLAIAAGAAIASLLLSLRAARASSLSVIGKMDDYYKDVTKGLCYKRIDGVGIVIDCATWAKERDAATAIEFGD